MKQTITFFIVLTLLLSAGVGCNKKMDVNSVHMGTELTEWKSIDDARSHLLGIYALFRAALANNNNYWLWGELRSGDFVSVARSDLKAVINGKLNASYQLVEDMNDWRRFYAVVNAASLFIERSGQILPLDPRYTDLNSKVDIAQAKALRAWAYFMMVRIWGDVPLITNSYDGQFPQLPRTPQDRVLAFCQKELLEAIEDLPFRYGVDFDQLLPGLYYGQSRDVWKNYLINRASAYGLLAHIAAWQGRYGDASIYAQFVLDNAAKLSLAYSTINDIISPDGIFFSGGNDINYRLLLGFSFAYNNGETGISGQGHLESWTLASPIISKPQPDLYVPATTINNAFPDTRDQRFGIDTISKLPREAYFIKYNSEIPVFSKIKVLGKGSTDGQLGIFSSSIMFSRLEEITLLKAEADAVLGNINGNEGAIASLNIIRTRRGLKGYTMDEGGDLIDAIFAERRRELMGEGWRWYDLVRYNKIKRGDPEFNKLIDQGGIYWPVSQSVLGANPAVLQNGYWQAAK